MLDYGTVTNRLYKAKSREERENKEVDRVDSLESPEHRNWLQHLILELEED